MEKKRIRSLDFIRVAGVYGVVIYHLWLSFPLENMERFMRFGVYNCLALSGFLFGYRQFSVSTEERLSANYLLKKLREFYPGHLFAFLLAASLELLHLREAGNLGASLPQFLGKAELNLLLMQSWVPSSNYYYSFNGASWFLSSILLFYFLAPSLLQLLKKWKPGLRAALALLLMVPFLYFFRFSLEGNDFSTWLGYINPLVNLLFLTVACIFGMGAKELQEKGKKSGTAVGTVLALLTLICNVFHVNVSPEGPALMGFLSVVGWNLAVLALPFVLSFENPITRFLFGNPVFTFLGSFSFEVFILHMPIRDWVGEVCRRRGFEGHALPFALSLLLSMAVAYAFHFLQGVRKKRVLRKRSGES